MAMNPMQKKARTSFLLGMLLTLVITGIIIGLLILQLSKMKQEQAAKVYQKVYVLNSDVISGDVLLGNRIKCSSKQCYYRCKYGFIYNR